MGTAQSGIHHVLGYTFVQLLAKSRGSGYRMTPKARFSSACFTCKWDLLVKYISPCDNVQIKSKLMMPYILIHYVCNTHFHLMWRRKFAALKSNCLCHESNDVTSLATRRSNITKRFWKSVLSEWIRMVITRFVIEWFAGINCII